MSDRFLDWMILIMRFFLFFYSLLLPYYFRFINIAYNLKKNRLCSASRVIYEIDVRGILI